MTPYATYIKIGLSLIFICGVFFAGWHSRDRDFSVYKDQVRVAAQEQAAQVESIKKQQEITTTLIQKEYDAKLNLLRQYYANGVRQSGSSPMSGISSTSKLSDAIAAYNQLASDCAATTLQTVTLQQWINEQMSIK